MVDFEEPRLGAIGRRLLASGSTATRSLKVQFDPNANGDWDSCWKVGQYKWRWYGSPVLFCFQHVFTYAMWSPKFAGGVVTPYNMRRKLRGPYSVARTYDIANIVMTLTGVCCFLV